MAEPYYEHGGITIYHGDCREVVEWQDFGEGVVEPMALITDPPYGISHSSNYGASWQGTTIEGDTSTAARDSILGWWRSFAGESAPAAVFGTWKVPHPAGTRACVVWDKGPAFGMGDLSLPWKASWEEIYILGDGWIGRRDEGVLKGHLVVSWESKGRVHPHQKPTTLIQHFINKLPAYLVIDPFMGSGTTLVAAKNLGRRAIGIEIEERYCEIAAQRLSQEVLDLGGVV